MNLMTFGYIITEIKLMEVCSFENRVPRYFNNALTNSDQNLGKDLLNQFRVHEECLFSNSLFKKKIHFFFIFVF